MKLSARKINNFILEKSFQLFWLLVLIFLSVSLFIFYRYDFLPKNENINAFGSKNLEFNEKAYNNLKTLLNKREEEYKIINYQNIKDIFSP